MKRLLFVFNPRSGKGLIKNHLLEIIECFSRNDYDVITHPTKCQSDARDVVMSMDGQYDRVVCSGGDGTVNEVIDGLLRIGSQVPLGYIPAGSTNDFANSIRLPKKMGNAAATAVEGEIRPLDMGDFNGRAFVYVAAFGAFTEVSYATSQNLKNMLGHQAYILEGMKQLMSIKPYHMKVSFEDQVIEDDFIFGMVSNSKSVGGFKGITGEHVHMDDGVMELTLIRKIRNPLDLNSITTALLGKGKTSERVIRAKVDQIVFESPAPMPWVLDGEFGGDQTYVEIKDLHKVVNMVVGKMGKTT